MDKILFTPFNVDHSFYDIIYNNVLVANELKKTNDIKYQKLYCCLLQIYLSELLCKRTLNVAPVHEFKPGCAYKIIYLNCDNIYHALSLTAGLRSRDISKGIESELSEAVYSIVYCLYKEMRMQMRDYDPTEFQDV